MAFNNEVIMEEIEALQAIMMDEVDILYSDSGVPNEVKVTVTPATAQNVEEQHVRVTLVVTLPPNYPDESPSITMRNPKGIDEDVLIYINRESKKKCEEFLGCPVIYELIELVRENLTANNTPSCPCAICLFHFTTDDTFSKTSCFHYFHSFCLGRYILNCEELAAVEERQNQQPVWMTREKRELLCPVCREPLQEQFDGVRLFGNAPPEEGENLEDFCPNSPRIKELQERMSSLYMKQKAKGGIIDLEEEKNRFLISASVEESLLHEDIDESLLLERNSGADTEATSSSNSYQHGRLETNPKKRTQFAKNQTRRDNQGNLSWNTRGRSVPKRGGGRPNNSYRIDERKQRRLPKQNQDFVSKNLGKEEIPKATEDSSKNSKSNTKNRIKYTKGSASNACPESLS